MYLELTKGICSGLKFHVAQGPGEWMRVLSSIQDLGVFKSTVVFEISLPPNTFGLDSRKIIPRHANPVYYHPLC